MVCSFSITFSFNSSSASFLALSRAPARLFCTLFSMVNSISPPGVFQFPFSAKYFDLGFLRLGEFDIPLSQDFLKLGDFLNSLLKVIAKSQLGFFLFLCGDSSPFLLEFLIYLLVESFFGSL